MKFISPVLVMMFSLTMFSCTDKRITAYSKIVDQAVRFKIHFLSENHSFFLKQSDVERFKQVLAGEVSTDTLSALSGDTRIEFIGSNSQAIATITVINSDKPTANFNSENLNFGFRLPYRLGMWVSELKYKNYGR